MIKAAIIDRFPVAIEGIYTEDSFASFWMSVLGSSSIGVGGLHAGFEWHYVLPVVTVLGTVSWFCLRLVFKIATERSEVLVRLEGMGDSIKRLYESIESKDLENLHRFNNHADRLREIEKKQAKIKGILIAEGKLEDDE